MRTFLLICTSLGAVALLSSCTAMHHPDVAAKPGAEDAPPPPAAVETNADDQDDNEKKRADLQRSLPVAVEKVKRAELAVEHQSAGTKAAIANAERAYELSLRKLAIFREQEAPLRVEQARLSLRRARDYAQEQEEELDQLELMYSEDDLAEKTAEIVLERGRRRLERARRALQLEATELENLQKDADEKERELQAARRTGELDRLDKQIALMEAQTEVARLEAELADLDDKEKEDEE